MSSPLYFQFFLLINWTDKSQLLVVQNSALPGPKQCSSWVVGNYGGPLTQIAWEQFMDSFQCPEWKLFLPPHAYKTCDVITLKGLTTLVRSQASLLIEVSWSSAQSLKTKMSPKKAAADPKRGKPGSWHRNPSASCPRGQHHMANKAASLEPCLTKTFHHTGLKLGVGHCSYSMKK